MDTESNLWEDFLAVTEGVFMVAGCILAVAQLINGELDVTKNFIE